MTTDVHESVFNYLQPTADQVEQMKAARAAYTELWKAIGGLMPISADRTHVLRLIRTAAMWTNVALTRESDGTPR